MRQAGRLRDRARFSQSDTSPSVTGAKHVLINNRPALRILDEGGTTSSDVQWRAKSGAPRVLFEGRHAHRTGDIVLHEGKEGRLAEGSANVVVGNFDRDNGKNAPKVEVRILHEGGEAAGHEHYDVLDEGGSVIGTGVTDALGWARLKVPRWGTYQIRLRSGWVVSFR